MRPKIEMKKIGKQEAILYEGFKYQNYKRSKALFIALGAIAFCTAISTITLLHVLNPDAPLLQLLVFDLLLGFVGFIGVMAILSGFTYLKFQIFETGLVPARKKFKEVSKEVFLKFEDMVQVTLSQFPIASGDVFQRRVLGIRMKDGREYNVSNVDFADTSKFWPRDAGEFDKILNILKDRVPIQIVDRKTKEVIGIYGEKKGEK